MCIPWFVYCVGLRRTFRKWFLLSTVWIQTQVFTLDGSCLHLLSHLPGPKLIIPRRFIFPRLFRGACLFVCLFNSTSELTYLGLGCWLNFVVPIIIWLRYLQCSNGVKLQWGFHIAPGLYLSSLCIHGTGYNPLNHFEHGITTAEATTTDERAQHDTVTITN